MDFDLSATAPTRWLHRLALTGIFMAIAIVVCGIVWQVEYRWVWVEAVHQFPGRDASVRLVTVDLGTGHRAIRTSDRLLRVTPHAQVCLSERRIVGRRWQHYALVLPGYCPLRPPPPEDAGTSAGPLPLR